MVTAQGQLRGISDTTCLALPFVASGSTDPDQPSRRYLMQKAS